MINILKKTMHFWLLILFVAAGVLAMGYSLQAYPHKLNIFSRIEESESNKLVEKKSVAIFPTVKSVTPEDRAIDVILDIEDPITINFDNSTEDFFIKFVINPESDVAYENNLQKTQFRLLPKQAIIDGQEYQIVVYAKYENEGDENYKKIFESSFKTLPPVPASWEADLELRVQQARHLTRAQIKIGKYIDINLASQIMTIFEEGKVLDAFVVSSGKRGMDTPKGSFKVENKANRPFSSTYGLYMPNWMAITPSGKFGIHELPEWPSGYKEGANHLGTPVSHGCVRLDVGAAKRVFDWAEIGTPIVIH